MITKILENPMSLCRRCWKRNHIGFLAAGIVGALLLFTGGPGLTQRSEAKQFPKSPERQLILLTYGRTGSTFTSAIISHDKNVFYVAEPLHHMPKPNDIYSKEVSNTTILAAQNIVRAYLSCDFEALDATVLNTIMLQPSNSTKPLANCFLLKAVHPSRYIQCFLDTVKLCRRKPVSYVKTIRMRVSWIRWLLQQFPKLKLLYLVRDPRATLYSQSEHFGTLNTNVTSEVVDQSNFLCYKMRQDIVSFRELSNLFPGRLKAFRYEDGALFPRKFAQELYDFAQLSYNKEIEQFMDSIVASTSSSPRLKLDQYGYIKKNSVVAMNKWRKKAQMKVVEIVDNSCKDLYPVLGYKMVASRQLLDSEDFLHEEPSKGGIFNPT